MRNLSRTLAFSSKYQFASNLELKRDNELKIAKKIK